MLDPTNPIDRICAIINRDGFTGLTDAEAGFFAIYWFVLETNNGGIDSFFFNDSGQFALPALKYLQTIGASKTASILRRAIALFPQGTVPVDQTERRALMEVLEEQDISFGPLTDELFACKEDVDNFHRAYAAAHPKLFDRVRGEAAS